MERGKIKIGITQGDINGTSYEIMLKAFQDQLLTDMCTPIIYGSPKVSAYYRKALNVVNSSFNSIQNVDEVQERKVNLLNVLNDETKVELGKATQMSAEASVTSLSMAVSDLADGKTSAMVLNPINTSLTVGLNVVDQFDFIKKKLGVDNVVTMLVNDTLKVALLSDAVPMRDVPKNLSVDKVVSKLQIVSNALKSDFCIEKPKIAVLGYNPNCNIAKTLESEEREILMPAIDKANAEGILAMGPYDADLVFGTDLFKQFDAVFAIYYSQGIVPFRAISYDDGVSYLLGIPQVCVAPFQSLGYENAGLDQAQFGAFQKAVCLACDVLENRALYGKLISNQLQHSNISD